MRKKQNNSNHSRKASQRRGEHVSTPAADSRSTPTPAAAAPPAAPPLYGRIKISIDVHGRFYMFSRQLDDATPQPPQSLSPEQFLAFAAKQVKLAREVYTCYEAGAFGYGLHRDLTALGIRNLVVRPMQLKENGKNTRTDRTDTNELVQRLDRFVAGNKKALPVVRVPTADQELARQSTRLRQTFKKERNRWRSRGKSLLLYWGLRVGSTWYRPRQWDSLLQRIREKHPTEVAERIVEDLGAFREMALLMEQKLTEHTRTVEASGRSRLESRQTFNAAAPDEGKPAAAPSASTPPPAPADARSQDAPKPKGLIQRILGMGPLLYESISAEIGDWKRFTGRRQVASYTGLCPGASGSGGKTVGLSINRCGNRRLRADLTELAWLMYHYQPKYKAVLRWKKDLCGKSGQRRRKAIVALARRLAIDLWRLETGQTTAAKLGLKLRGL